MSSPAFALPARGVSAATSRLRSKRHRINPRGLSRVRAKSSDGSDETDDVTDFSLSALAKRVEQIKRDEASGTTTMRVIVLDATLPGQRLGLRFDRRDTKRALNAGTALGSLTEPGDTYVMLGQAPLSGQVLPMGTEVRVSRVSPFPDGSGDVEVELVGIRRLRIEGQPFDENGVAMAKTRPMDFAPEALWSTSVGDESVRGGDLDMIKGAHPAAARRGNPRDADSENSESLAASLNAAMAENLEPLVDEWKRLVVDGGHERRKGQIDLILGHLGPMPAAREPARRAVWVAALINPIPALGVAYEIRPALLMSRDTTGMLKIATDGIATSIERLRPKEEPSCSEKKKDEDDETTE